MTAKTVILTGSHGMLGQKVAELLTQQGYIVKTLKHTAQPQHADEWNADSGFLAPAKVSGADAVIHLGGSSISNPWSTSYKNYLLHNRTTAVEALAEACAKASTPPKTLIIASAVGYYLNKFSTGEIPKTETSPNGNSFSAQVCAAIEHATEAAKLGGTRVVFLRFGVILHRCGGMLKKLYWPFYFGMGGSAGSGMQHISWVSRDDAAHAVLFALQQPKLNGAVNVSAPALTTYWDFSKQLALCLHRPHWLHLPSWLIQKQFGEMGEELILSGVYAYPEKLLQHGFSFQHTELAHALSAALEK